MSDENSTTHSITEAPFDTVPQTATQAIRLPKKRGRKGNKIVKAFEDIPRDAVNFEDYARDHGVSPKVLRQIKRHDKFTELGKVFVRKNKQTQTMMIWRAVPITE